LNIASVRTAIIFAAIVAIGAFALFSIGGATAQQACIQPLSGNGTYNGTWDNTCLSENTPLGDYSFPTGTRYARFYTFTLSAPSTVTIELNSSADTYLYLMQGTGKAGTVLHYNDDITRNEDPNSRISQSLTAADYTIEATTYDVENTGSFTLTVSGLPDIAIPTATPTLGVGESPTATSTPISGQATPTVIPTRTATQTITPTPTQPPAPDNVLNRLTALETRSATQQGLIATLESKITALDSRVATLEAASPTPTLAPVPTPTPIRERTATPIPTGDGSKRSSALPYGVKFQAGLLDIQITDVDLDAWPEILEENQFNNPPAEGWRHLMWTFSVQNARGSIDDYEWISDSSFHLIGSYNVNYQPFREENRCGVIPNELSDRLYLDGSTEGNVCLSVPIDETDLIFRYDTYHTDSEGESFKVDVWFKALDK